MNKAHFLTRTQRQWPRKTFNNAPLIAAVQHYNSPSVQHWRMGISSSASFLCPTRKENSPESKWFPQSSTKFWWLKSLPSSLLQVTFGCEWNLILCFNLSLCKWVSHYNLGAWHTKRHYCSLLCGLVRLVHPSYCCQLPGLTHVAVFGGA